MCVMTERALTLLILVSISARAVGGSVIVYTKDGALKGTEYITVGGRSVTAFLGVPYARPPLGDLRFKEPRPVEKWSGVRNASEFGSKCIQLSLYTTSASRIQGEENCLFLNIYTPKVSNDSKLNVVLYIHGGAFMCGKGDNFRPDFILDSYDVVFISINYRVGPFGFMSTEDTVIPGNNGLKDQVLALRWVQRNIDRFGGDRRKVTITGLSAGGASVHLHYLSPLSRDLFRQGISISGTALCPWVFAENAKIKAHMLANSVGCSSINSKTLLLCMQQKDATLIVSKIEQLFMPWHDNPFSPFGLVVEGGSTSAFISTNPYEMLTAGNVKNAPWLTSATTDEGLFPAATFLMKNERMEELNANWDKLAPHLLDFNHTAAYGRSNEISQSIRKYYLGDEKINSSNRNMLIKMMSDRLFLVDIERAARLQAASTRSPVYFYSFAYRGKYSFTEFMCECKDYLGVSHVDDFKYLNTGWFPLETEEDKAMAKTLVKIWQSFVELGDPSAYIDPVWSPVASNALHSDGNMSYLLISSSTDIQPMSSTDLGNREFWDTLPLIEFSNTMYKNKRKLVDEL